MSSIRLFIAISLDGFIASENGSIDWLLSLSNPQNCDHGYNDFIAGVDTLIMGSRTYESLLGLTNEWPYPDKSTYVVSLNPEYEVKSPNTIVLNELTLQQIDKVKSESHSSIWLVGGGQIVSCLLNLGRIDSMIISVIPVILGKGIPLFQFVDKLHDLSLINSVSYDTGVVNLFYEVK